MSAVVFVWEETTQIQSTETLLIIKTVEVNSQQLIDSSFVPVQMSIIRADCKSNVQFRALKLDKMFPSCPSASLSKPCLSYQTSDFIDANEFNKTTSAPSADVFTEWKMK